MTERTETAGAVAKKSYRDGCVAIGITLKCQGGFGSDSARIEASTNLTTDQARELAQSLVDLADREDAKMAKKSEAAERRQKYVDREVAAGRMKIFRSL